MLNNMYYVLSYNCHEHVHEHKKLYSFCLICNFAEISNQSTGSQSKKIFLHIKNVPNVTARSTRQVLISNRTLLFQVFFTSQ